MIGSAKAKMMQKAAQRIDITENALAQRLAREAARRERRQADEVRALAEAMGAEVPGDGDLPTVEERQQTLVECADAVASQRFPAWWWDRYGDDWTDHPDEARECVGLSGEEWREQMTEWHRRYYERGVVDTPPEDAGAAVAATAARHVEAVHGVDLPTFVAEIVNWSPQRHLRSILSGPIETNTQAIRALRLAVEADDGAES